MSRRTPSYKGLKPSSPHASRAARGSSRKAGTRPEVLLRKALWSAGCRYRKNVQDLYGKPDIVFRKLRLAVFCDGDFWHGRDWENRKPRLERGANAAYWVQKIEGNMARDRENTWRLIGDGWCVIRLWESEILRNPSAAARIVIAEWKTLRKPSSKGCPL